MSLRANGLELDVAELRRCLRRFVTGVTVVTTADGSGTVHGLTVNSFSSVSLEPPLILWSQRLTSPPSLPSWDHDRFAVNVLSAEQGAVAHKFATPSADKFSGIPVTEGLGKVPLDHGLRCASRPELGHDLAMAGIAGR